MSTKQYSKIWRDKNIEHVRAYDRKYYKNKPDNKRKRANKYYESNKEKVKKAHGKYYLENKEKVLAKNRERKNKNRALYNKNLRESRLNKLEKIAGRQMSPICEICGEGNLKIVFDHDHATGKFRGWICWNCNVSLGHARDNVKTLNKMVEYLVKNNPKKYIEAQIEEILTVPLNQ